ncbi:hypothetical protein B0H14DRAFT_3671794, partial [Mycena olivaceomarginata]
EKSILFRRYITLHSLVTTGAFSVALAWIILSLSKHSTAKSNCLASFFAHADSTQETEAETLCNIFPWVDVGVMGGLWVIMAIMHIYLYVVISGYSSAQQRDHAQYDALKDSAIPNENIALNRYSGDAPYQRHNVGRADYEHLRRESAVSMSDVLSEPMQQAHDPYSMGRQGSYPPPQRQPSLPANTYPQNEAPTPRVGQSYYSDRTMASEPGNYVEKPAISQAHPGE